MVPRHPVERGLAFWKAIWSGADTKTCFIQLSASDTTVAQTYFWFMPNFWIMASAGWGGGGGEVFIFLFSFFSQMPKEGALSHLPVPLKDLSSLEEQSIHRAGTAARKSLVRHHRPTTATPSPRLNSFTYATVGSLPTSNCLFAVGKVGIWKKKDLETLWISFPDMHNERSAWCSVMSHLLSKSSDSSGVCNLQLQAMCGSSVSLKWLPVFLKPLT